jgi:hypothetical protein
MLPMDVDDRFMQTSRTCSRNMVPEEG